MMFNHEDVGEAKLFGEQNIVNIGS